MCRLERSKRRLLDDSNERVVEDGRAIRSAEFCKNWILRTLLSFHLFISLDSDPVTSTMAFRGISELDLQFLSSPLDEIESRY